MTIQYNTSYPFLFILPLEVFSRDIWQDERNSGVKVKKEVYKLRAFSDDLVLILEDSMEEIEILGGKEFAMLAGFKSNTKN